MPTVFGVDVLTHDYDVGGVLWGNMGLHRPIVLDCAS
jgi:hypothetical protein